MRRSTLGLFLVALAACASPKAPVGTGSGSPSGSAEVSASPTLITPQPGSSIGHASPTPKQTKSAPPGSSTVTVTESDSGKTIRLKVGQKLEVRLPAEYVQPTAKENGVLVRTSASGGYPSHSEVLALFEARLSGRSTVASSTDYACLHATPSCALPQRQWNIEVLVAPA